MKMLKFNLQIFASKKGAGSTRNGRDSNPKYLGVKKFGSERVLSGYIIVRQRGTKFHPGKNVGIGKDHTIYSLVEGYVKFQTLRDGKKIINVIPA